jgi:hypothetical protein
MARHKSSYRNLTLPVVALALAAAACADPAETDDTNWFAGSTAGGGGTTGTATPGGGGSTTGGSASGGSASGGSASGGSASGGSASGGALSGGALFGGTASGGAASGGSASGGSASGISATGGSASGGAAAGGSASGGSASGGSAAGGSAAGGSASGGGTTGGTVAGGSASGGTTSGGGTTGGTVAGGSTAGGSASGGGTTGGRTAGGGATTGGGGGGFLSGLAGGGGTVDYKAGDCCTSPTECSKCITEPPATFSGEVRGPWGGLLGGGGSTIELSEATVYVPPAAASTKGKLAGFAIIPGFTNVGPEMAAWGPYFSGWGIVTAVTYSGPLDTPGLRGQWLLDAVAAMKKASGLQGKMSGNYGTGGYSMGGGGTTVASTSDKSLRSSMGLAPWAPGGRGITTPTIHFCGGSDLVAGCSSNASWAYSDLPTTTPKALVVISGCDHLLCWFSPDSTTGEIGLIWNKVFLEGDKRWGKLLLNSLKGGLGETVQTNVTQALLDK